MSTSSPWYMKCSVGGDAQTKAKKSAAGAIRLDLAQYREMEVFTMLPPPSSSLRWAERSSSREWR